MKKLILAASLLAAFGASAHELTYNVTTVWREPDTQPRNTIFQGSFDYDEHTGTVSNLHGMLSESMTGDPNSSAADYGMTWLTLSHQLVTQQDAGLGGTFAAVFRNPNTTTFFGGAWSPEDGIAVGGVYAGFPLSPNPGNAYALIFVPDDPTAALSQAQLDKLAYADCAPGGMMGAVCMTGTSVGGYGAVGTMSGYPLSQTITAAVPEPSTYAMLLGGIALLGLKLRRRQA